MGEGELELGNCLLCEKCGNVFGASGLGQAQIQGLHPAIS